MSTLNAVSAFIHDQLGKTLKDFFHREGTFQETEDVKALSSLVGISSREGSLLDQLKQVDEPGDETKPPKVNLTLTLGDIIDSSMSSLLQAFASSATIALPLPLRPESLNNLLNLLSTRLNFFTQPGTPLRALITARDPHVIQSASQSMLLSSDLTNKLQNFPIGSDIGVLLALLTIGNAAHGIHDAKQLADNVEQAWLDYFFNKEGYRTIDGARIIAPIHLSDAVSALHIGADGPTGLDQLKNLFSKATAEHYLRDKIRVTVEAVYDTVRKLGGSDGEYESIKKRVQKCKDTTAQKAAIERKFVNWFRGFSSVAESAAMRAVEVGFQGVSEFQTNPLIAAALGSFAGTVARKLAQDSLLAVLHSDSKLPA